MQPYKSSIAAKIAVVVRDEKEGQPHQLIFGKTTDSNQIFGPYGNLAAYFEIRNLEKFKKLETISIRCTVEYDIEDNLKASENLSKQTESSITDVICNPKKLPVPSINNKNRCIVNSDKNDLKASDAQINQPVSPIIDVDQHSSTGLIRQDFEQLLNHQSATDIFFIIGSNRLRAHKLILSARSAVFTAIIKAAEANDNLMDGIEICDMPFISFKELIHFIYTDQVFLTEIAKNSKISSLTQKKSSGWDFSSCFQPCVFITSA